MLALFLRNSRCTAFVRHAATAGVLLLWLLVLAGSGAAQAVDEIRFRHQLEGDAAAELAAIVEQFHAGQATPAGTLSNELRQADVPHLVQFPDTETAALVASRGAVRPLWQVLAEAGARSESWGYHAVAASALQDGNGRLLALPFAASSALLFHNRAHFRRARLDPARPPQTWFQMPEMLGELREAGIDCPYVSSGISSIHLEALSARHGQEFASRRNGHGGPGSTLTIATRVTVRHIATLNTWAKARYFFSATESVAERRFAAGECALLTAPSSAAARLAAAGKVDFGVSPLPFYDDAPGAPLPAPIDMSGLWASAAVGRAEARSLATFLSWLSRAETQLAWARSGFLPLTQDAIARAARSPTASHPAIDAAIRQTALVAGGGATSQKAEPRGIRLGPLGAIRALVDEEMGAVLRGDKTTRDALDHLSERANALIRAFEKGTGQRN
jgi:sn-glycerol 3-phosphate transport system substrate-binding protein